MNARIWSRKSSRAPVKKSSGVLKISLERQGTSQDVQIVDDRTAAQIEEVLAHSTIARPSSLPMANMSQRMLNGDPLTQLASSLRGLLTLAHVNGRGVGLASMRERMAAHDGTLTISSAAGATTVEATIPLHTASKPTQEATR